MWAPRLIKALGRQAAPGATAATWSVARDLRAGLTTAGFEVQRASGIGGKREITVARWAPRFVPRGAGAGGCALTAPRAVVVGAGLAGAAAAQALARLGVAVTVLDRHAEPAAETSGNPAGLFHGTVNADDGTHARLLSRRGPGGAACLPRGGRRRRGRPRRRPAEAGHARRRRRRDAGLAAAPGPATGLRAGPRRRRRVARWPACAAAPPAWFYPGGGWIAPPAWVRHALATPGVHFCGGVQVAALERHGSRLAAARCGRKRGRAGAHRRARQRRRRGAAAGPAGRAGWPLEHSRGQVTQWAAPGRPAAGRCRWPATVTRCRCPRAACCAAPRARPATPGDDPAPRLADHRINLDRLQRLTGLAPPREPARPCRAASAGDCTATTACPLPAPCRWPGPHGAGPASRPGAAAAAGARACSS